MHVVGLEDESARADEQPALPLAGAHVGQRHVLHVVRGRVPQRGQRVLRSVQPSRASDSVVGAAGGYEEKRMARDGVEQVETHLEQVLALLQQEQVEARARARHSRTRKRNGTQRDGTGERTRESLRARELERTTRELERAREL